MRSTLKNRESALKKLLLHCDIYAGFRLIAAPDRGFLVWGLMISGDNGLGLGLGLGAGHRLVKIVSAPVALGLVKGRRMSQRHLDGALAGAALLLVALALGGCSTSIGDIPLGSVSSDARAKEPGAYLPVNESPPARDEAAMDPAERAKVQKELIAARERQASAVTAKDQGQAKDQSQSPNQAAK